MSSLEERLKARAREIGFDLVGIAPAVVPAGAESLRAWLEQGYAGEMAYMYRHAAARTEPAAVLAEVRSVVMVAMNYAPPRRPQDGTGPRAAIEQSSLQGEPGPIRGRVSCYAWGEDYHELLRDRLRQLLKWVQDQVPECKGRGVVDTAPLLERDFARLAGLGWFGKNTMLLNTRLGSYFFIGALLLDTALEPDPPFELSHCGSCTACLDACPTDAFAAPGVLDARRCISYLTIELRGPVPAELRQPMGDWVFGCDVCQEVCPWNRKAPATREPGFQPRADLDRPDLIELVRLTPEEYRRRFRGTTMTRAKRAGLVRNAAIALGNSGDPRAVSPLIERLIDPEPAIRGAAAWALGQIGGPEARTALGARLEMEPDNVVRAELEGALKTVDSRVPS